jgi:small subunit ribosomal protein S6
VNEKEKSMRAYETIFIVHPDLVDEEVKALTEGMKGVIENLNGELITIEEWGRRKLAYKLKKLTKGSYVLIRFMGNGEVLAELERNLRLSDGVLKYQSVTLDETALQTTHPVEEIGPPEEGESPEKTEPPGEAKPSEGAKPREEAEPAETKQLKGEAKPEEEAPSPEEGKPREKEPPSVEEAKLDEDRGAEKEGEN